MYRNWTQSPATGGQEGGVDCGATRGVKHLQPTTLNLPTDNIDLGDLVLEWSKVLSTFDDV